MHGGRKRTRRRIYLALRLLQGDEAVRDVPPDVAARRARLDRLGDGHAVAVFRVVAVALGPFLPRVLPAHAADHVVGESGSGLWHDISLTTVDDKPLPRWRSASNLAQIAERVDQTIS